MQTVVYGDILFAVNFSMDFLTLYLTCRVLKLRVRLIPLVVASAVGAFYAVAALLFETGQITDTIITIAASLLVSYIAFGYTRLRDYLRDTVVFWAVGLMLGGIITAIFNAVNRLVGVSYPRYGLSALDGFGVMNGLGAASSGLPPRLMLTAAVAAAIFTLVVSRISSGRIESRSVAITAEYYGRRAQFDALYDSGNLLTEPISGRQVVILNGESFDELTGGCESLLKMGIEARLRFIPTSGVSGEGVLTGIVPDRCLIGERERDVVIARGDGDGYAGYEGIVGGIV